MAQIYTDKALNIQSQFLHNSVSRFTLGGKKIIWKGTIRTPQGFIDFLHDGTYAEYAIVLRGTEYRRAYRTVLPDDESKANRWITDKARKFMVDVMGIKSLVWGKQD